MKSNAMNQILEGVVGTLLGGQLNYPQSLTFWLRAMKECINFNGRFIEDDHVLGVVAGAVGTTGDGSGTDAPTVKADATWVYGMLATNIDANIDVAILANGLSFNPGTTALDFYGVVNLPAGTTTTPSASGLVWFPFCYFDVSVAAFAVTQADYTTAAGASEVNIWVPYRNQ